MKENGFIASSLLYGMLALFLVIIVGTLSILGNRKLGMDKIKSDALNTIRFEYSQMGSIYAIYDGFQLPSNNVWKDQSGNGNDATTMGFPSNSFTNRHIIFNNDGYIDTNIKQSLLVPQKDSEQEAKHQFTLQTVINIQDLGDINNPIGLWGWYNANDKEGIYAEIGTVPGDETTPGEGLIEGENPGELGTKARALNFCVYTNQDEGDVPSCVSIGTENLNNYLNRTIQLTVVVNNQPIEVNYTEEEKNAIVNSRLEAELQQNPNANIEQLREQIEQDLVEVKSGIDVYINGIPAADRLDLPTGFQVKPLGSNLIIGQSNNNVQKFKGFLYNFTIYKRALTYNEITKNYNADKLKYNIPD